MLAGDCIFRQLKYFEFMRRSGNSHPTGGVPIFSQTRAAEQGQVEQAFGSRLEFFRKFRRRLDRDGRLLNPYLAQYLA